MDKDTLVLIAGQLTKDKLSMIEMHEQLIERMGNTQEAEDYVYKEHLGSYIQALDNLIVKLLVCTQTQVEKIEQKEFVVVSAQLQNDKNQIDKILSELKSSPAGFGIDGYPHEYERYLQWESELLESLLLTFRNNFADQ